MTSGRPREYVKKIAKECGTSKYIITSNGAEIYDFEEDKVIYSEGIDKESIIKVCKSAEENKLHYAITSGKERYINYKDDQKNEIMVNDLEKLINNIQPIQIVISDSDYDKVKSLRKEIDKISNIYPINMHKSLIDEKLPRTGRIYYDLVKKGVNKGTAISIFTKYFGVSLDNVAAIGDSDNDIEMIKIAGLGIAMGNSTEGLKIKADYVTLDNTQEGFNFAAKYIINNNIKLTKK